VYSINGNHPQVLDLRDVEETGLPAHPGDTLTIEEIRYRSNASSDEQQVNVEGFLNSVGDDWDKHIYTTPDKIQAGIHRLPDVSSLTWVIPDHEDSLILSLWRIEDGPNVVMDGLWLPFGAEESRGLVPASEAVLWPFDRSTFLDFEDDTDLEYWSGSVRRSSDQAFSGSHALEVTLQVTDTSPFGGISFWQKEFEADGVALHYYLPSASGVEIGEIDFCLVPGWPCKYLDRTRDQWHTIVLDFSVWPEDADPPFHERELSALGLQGQITAPGVTEAISYSIYLDAIQIFDRESP
jgi:hypothetical protein